LRIHAVDEAGNPSDSNFEGLIISDKVIRVSLTKQEMTAFSGDRVDLRTLVTTGGQELPTPVGNFEILDKSAPFTFRSPWPQGSPYWYPTATVNYAMLFSVKDETFIHDNNWRTVFGPGTNGAGVPGSLYSGSHGCVNTPPAAMAQLFNWAQLGTPVIIQP
jgi:lipoprotein-anchoring transpeptidase ErfK/SrfK